jgi:hypothetical protein
MAVDADKVTNAVKDILDAGKNIVQRYDASKTSSILAADRKKLSAAFSYLSNSGVDVLLSIRKGLGTPAPTTPVLSNDSMNPTQVRGLTVTPIYVGGQPGYDLAWDAASDPYKDGTEYWTGLQDYQVFRDGSTTALASVSCATGDQIVLSSRNVGTTTIGSSVRSSGNWTQISDGSGQLGTASDSFRATGAALTGDYTMSTTIVSCTSTGAGEQVGLRVANGTGANTECVSVIAHPTDCTINYSTAGVQTLLDTATGLVFPYAIRITRSGSSFTMDVMQDSNTVVKTVTKTGTTIPSSAQWDVFTASKTALTSVTSVFSEPSFSTAARVTYRDLPVTAGSHSYTITARDRTQNKGPTSYSISKATISSGILFPAPTGAAAPIVPGAPNTGALASKFGTDASPVWIWIDPTVDVNTVLTTYPGKTAEHKIGGFRTALRYNGPAVIMCARSGVLSTNSGFDMVNGQKIFSLAMTPSPGLWFAPNTYWRTNGDDILMWHIGNRLGSATPPTDVGNRDGFQCGPGSRQVFANCQSEFACDETFENYVGTNDACFWQSSCLEPLQDSGHPSGEAHGTGAVAHGGNRFQILRSSFISLNYRAPALFKQQNGLIADNAIINCGTTSSGPLYEGGLEITGPDNGSGFESLPVTLNTLANIFVRGPGHIAGTKPVNVFRNGTNNVPPAGTSLYFADNRYIDPYASKDWTWSQTDQNSYINLHGESSSLITGSLITAANLTGYNPYVVDGTLSNIVAKLNLILANAGPRPKDRAASRMAAAVTEVGNLLAQNGLTYPSHKNTNSGALSVSSVSIDPYAAGSYGGDPFPASPNTVEANGLTRGTNWLKRRHSDWCDN